MSDKTNDMIRELRRGVAMIHDALADPARPRQACGEVAAWWLRYAEACVSHVSPATGERVSAAPVTQIISEAPASICPICDIEGCRHIREAAPKRDFVADLERALKLQIEAIEDEHGPGAMERAVEYLRTARASMSVQPGAPVTVTYTNYRGDTEVRRIIPRHIWWGSTEWHSEPQWLLTAFDVDKGEERDFALKDFGQPAKTREPHPYAGLLKELEAVMARYDEAMPPDDENGMPAPIMLGPEYFRQIITAIRAQIGGAA